MSLSATTLSKLVPGRPGSGKEFLEVATVTQVVWDLFEDILHPRTRFNAGILAGSYQRVHYRCAICGGIIAAEEPVFSSLCWQYHYVGIVRYIIVYQCVGLRGRIPMLAVDMNAHLIYRILINWSTGSHISIFIRINVLINMELCKLFLAYFQ